LAIDTPNAPNQSDVANAVSAANSAISSAVGTTNGVISQANTEVGVAYQAADAAYQAGGCGTPPAAPQAQPPIDQ
jgi:dihydroorotate dehydrogenase